MLVLFPLITLGIPAALYFADIDLLAAASSTINSFLSGCQRGQKTLNALDKRYRWFAPATLIAMFVLYVLVMGFLGE